ncbi:H-NS histone family protein [Janthinobacterium agaricidamnosum]|uniref:H-NS histone family protein n=1 Tax=Janthinobacterium agaricidamnosum NBRC 102515 = DSM 9628 TaxID=1349767 RepID=W0V0S3_9BURK|nr:H-NS histone family protein [Janthinobacterium agaricidamnosum]CDG81446.1 H-NS histone family protein [Janthinobacterium agaricidamnosum NBRC 102515 = DSM 9628]
MDISNLTALELRHLQEKIKKEMKDRERQDLSKAREQILAIAQSVGLPLKELMSVVPARAKLGAVAVQFRNPADASLQWTGRGRQPKWVREWVESGKSIDLLRV